MIISTSPFHIIFICSCFVLSIACYHFYVLNLKKNKKVRCADDKPTKSPYCYLQNNVKTKLGDSLRCGILININMNSFHEMSSRSDENVASENSESEGESEDNKYNDVTHRSSEKREQISVVVLGDLGHSPRMNYHALSLAQEGFEVNLIGFAGTAPQIEILQNPNITLTYMKPCPRWIELLPSTLRFVCKVMWQSFILFFTLLLGSSCSKLLLQNPPAVPAMPVCWFYCFLTKAKFFIDWHNYGYTIMALNLSFKHPIVLLYRLTERIFGSLASGGLSVTMAMKEDLKINWGIDNVIVHYDRPHTRFHPITDENKHNFFLKMGNEYACFSSSSPDKTIFTERFADGRISSYEDRPALLVSSTSWTEDEDFSILLYALEDFERVRSEFPENYPHLIVAITGKGPLKQHYLNEINLRKWQHVEVITPWLSAEDYPKLLASADLGICLHFSSSGLDLPMKVVDMFGSGIPVMAITYQALPELVQHNINGLVFANKEELANLLQDWFRGYPKETAVKETYYSFYKNIAHFRKLTWHTSWVTNVLPLLTAD